MLYIYIVSLGIVEPLTTLNSNPRQQFREHYITFILREIGSLFFPKPSILRQTQGLPSQQVQRRRRRYSSCHRRHGDAHPPPQVDEQLPRHQA